MKGLLVFCLVFARLLGSSADLKYPVSSIPEDLKKDVNVVVREDKMVYTIYSRNKAALDVHFVVTVLNDRGNDVAQLTIYYDHLSKIDDLNAVVYDANGKQIKRLKNLEIYDQSAFGGSLFSDDRLKAVNLAQAVYPYTVEFEYRIEYKYLYSIPRTYLVDDERSVQNVSYELVFAAGLEPRYHVANIPESGAKPFRGKNLEGMEFLRWSFQDLKPVKVEPNGPRKSEQFPVIMAAPSEFEYDGYLGNMSSWKEYGNWNAMLNRDRDLLPEPTKAKVRELTNGLKTTEEKARALYEYMQSKTRYVSIQYGIGGLQTFPASLVDEKGYGDCKALSNYMIALLKVAGIKGYYTTVGAGREQPEVIVDFPSHQSNHVIVAIPNAKDTLWAECTSQTMPFGYLGGFTADRWALMITESGGKLVRTPTYSAEQSKQTRTANVTVDLSGNARAEIKTTYGAIQYDGADNMITDGPDDQKKWIESNTDIPAFSINSYSVKSTKGIIPTVQVKLNLTLNRYASVSGKRMFVATNLMNKLSTSLQKSEDRKSEVIRRSNLLYLDTILLHIPENLYPEFLPQPVKIQSRFGEYEGNYEFKDGVVVYIRRMKVWKGKFPKESYNELVDFFKNVSKADNAKLVFLNKT